MKKIKIVHVQVTPKLSGVQQVSLDILKGLCDDYYDKYIICGKLDKNSKQFVYEFEKANVHIIEVEEMLRDIGFKDVRLFFKLYSLFREYKFDIVHTNSTKPGVVARIAARLSGVKKVIHTVHGISFHRNITPIKRFFYFFIEYFSCLFGHVNVVVNKHYLKYYPLLNNKVIYNGVDFSGFSINKKESNDLIVAFMARLDEQKNPLLFIEAINELFKIDLDLSKVKFVIAGDGDLRTDCQELIEKYDLSSSVEMKGWIYNKSEFLSSVDIICQPSNWEAFGLIFVESAYFNIPAIGSDVEGIPEVIDDGLTGFIFPSGDVIQLRNKIKYLIVDEKLREELGKNAYKRCLDNFEVNIMLKKYIEIYEKV
ncbi:glycosyltransferase family 4 protein [Vibrio furnissii]|uniref:glycosyltransferase family 4 protein n=1 Tax=Vibrio furnissii TaxID=29494 RepID=UPI0024BB579F|nr:glycosyltransferase family 4 protein [Vibrio furnissii]WHR51324.1 glycosyltransferase family 4 protein [Vibrio furnissii]